MTIEELQQAILTLRARRDAAQRSVEQTLTPGGDFQQAQAALTALGQIERTLLAYEQLLAKVY